MAKSLLLRITNRTREKMLAARCEQARSFFARGKGLMGRDSLDPEGGLLIDPCSSIHMFFMRFPIDALFLNRKNEVVGVHHSLKPGVPYAGARGARYVIELPAGVLQSSGTAVGDTIELEPLGS